MSEFQLSMLCVCDSYALLQVIIETVLITIFHSIFHRLKATLLSVPLKLFKSKLY